MKIHEIREVPRYLRQRARMPVARFELVSSLDDGLVSVALDDVVLLDPEDTMEEVKDRAAQLAGTIPYELLCQLTPRIPRLYLEQGSAIS